MLAFQEEGEIHSAEVVHGTGDENSERKAVGGSGCGRRHQVMTRRCQSTFRQLADLG